MIGPYLLGPNDTRENGIYTGDARLLAEAIPDHSVDLIFADPEYDEIDDYRWLAETAARVLKPDGAYLAFCGIGWLAETLQALKDGGMPHRWLCAVFVPGAGSRVCLNTFGNWQALVWGGGIPRHTMSDAIISHTATLTGTHRWKKNLVPLAKYISWFIDVGMTVFDPFTGGGSVPSCCVMLDRKYLAFEIDPDTAKQARERVATTQPPLLTIEHEQLELV